MLQEYALYCKWPRFWRYSGFLPEVEYKNSNIHFLLNLSLEHIMKVIGHSLSGFSRGKVVCPGASRDFEIHTDGLKYLSLIPCVTKQVGSCIQNNSERQFLQLYQWAIVILAEFL